MLILPVVAKALDAYIRTHNLQKEEILGVGVGIPGPVNSDGVVNNCVNFGWGVFNIDSALSNLSGLRVRASNNANLAALGECWKGSGTQNMAFAVMNTGLGGALVCDGKVVFGAHGGGGELGHMLINKAEKEPCKCGKRGCVEQYVSPGGIVRVARRFLHNNRMPSRLRLHPIFDFREVLNAYDSGDKAAIEIMKQVFDYAGQFLANVSCVTNPDTIVLGGEFCRMGQSVLTGIEEAFKKYAFHANKQVHFQFAELGTDACIYGAFKLILDAVRE